MINRKLLNNIGIGVFIAFLIFGSILCIISGVRLQINHKYTIGRLYKVDGGFKSGLNLHYTYYINGKNFDITSTEECEDCISSCPPVIGKRYYVKFETNNPEHSVMLIDKPVPESIVEAPPEGWNEIPIPKE